MLDTAGEAVTMESVHLLRLDAKEEARVSVVRSSLTLLAGVMRYL
jgi:hypothetical protein